MSVYCDYTDEVMMSPRGPHNT